MDAIGIVRFDRGRLGFASREWFSEETSGSRADLMRTVIGTLSQVLVERQAACRLVDRSRRHPDGDLTILEFGCPDRRVSLSIIALRGQGVLGVTEIIGSDEPTAQELGRDTPAGRP